MTTEATKSSNLVARLEAIAVDAQSRDRPTIYEAAAEIKRLREHFRHIFDSYGPGYAAWDFMHIACDALGVPIPPVSLGQAEAERVQLERLRAALERAIEGIEAIS